MMDAQAVGIIQDIIRREGRSLLQYVRDAFPWVRNGEQEGLRQLQAVIAEEREGTAALVRLLTRHRVTPPYLGAYPMVFTNLNFVSFDSLVPRLVAHQRRAVAALENDLDRLRDPDARVEVHRLLEMKKRHLKTLEALPPAPRPAAVP